MQRKPLAPILIHVNAAILIGLALYFFLLPVGIVLRDLTDPHIRHPGMPRAAVRLFEALTPHYSRWARKRLDSDRAARLSSEDVSGTEWPLFGSVFYLWSVESLQQAWVQDNSLMPVEPKEYAREAIDAAARLVIDPNHASWVRERWGQDYLHRENVFYRMLVIAALTSHANLTGSEEHLALLRDQVESLSAELDGSPHGLLDDYPGECYPGDVLTAIACIRRADAVLGTDNSDFVRRAIRGFEGTCLDERGLVPYAAYSRSGEALGPSRGCGNSYVSLFVPEIWPAQAQEWYRLYEKHFWQRRWTAAGFREFPGDLEGYDWYMDVDAGPVMVGYGIAACAFGVGAARVNGRFDHAYPLTAEMLLASWPLPDGTLAVPRFLSNATDAPYLGEAAILLNLTRMPDAAAAVKEGGTIPWVVRIMLALLAGVGLVPIVAALLGVRRWHRRRAELRVARCRLQAVLWGMMLLGAIGCLLLSRFVPGMLLLLAMQFLPRTRRLKSETAA